MNIKGIQKTSLIDYPGKISAVIFTGGCNLRCGFCHNGDLALDNDAIPSVDNDEVLAFLRGRKHLLDAVTVSGGEPTLQPGLVSFLRSLRDMGYFIKLDTNGFSPEVVSSLCEKELVDYFALDIKTSPEKYADLTGVPVNFDEVKKTYGIIKNSGVNYELRMTCVPGFCDKQDLEKIGEVFGRVKSFYLQQFVSEHAMKKEFCQMTPLLPNFLCEMRQTCLQFADLCEIRGL